MAICGEGQHTNFTYEVLPSPTPTETALLSESPKSTDSHLSRQSTIGPQGERQSTINLEMSDKAAYTALLLPIMSK